MKALTLSQFESTVLGQGICEQFLIYPFYSDECKEYQKVITFSDKVDTLTFVEVQKKRIGMVMPFSKGENLYKILKKFQEDVKHYVGINSTIFSLYDFQHNKVQQVEFFKEGYWF